MRHGRRRDSGRKRRFGYFLLAVFGIALLLFLPGPNGAVSVLARHLRAVRLEKEIRTLSHEIDSLDARLRWLADPDSARELARHTFGSIRPDSAKTD